MYERGIGAILIILVVGGVVCFIGGLVILQAMNKLPQTTSANPDGTSTFTRKKPSQPPIATQQTIPTTYFATEAFRLTFDDKQWNVQGGKNSLLGSWRIRPSGTTDIFPQLFIEVSPITPQFATNRGNNFTALGLEKSQGSIKKGGLVYSGITKDPLAPTKAVSATYDVFATETHDYVVGYEYRIGETANETIAELRAMVRSFRPTD